jgi:hypothetical protein
MLFNGKMARESQNSSAIEAAARKIELIEGLQRAIDRKYRRLIEAARADWERLFAGKNPSDACVSFRIHSAETGTDARALPGSGFLKVRKPSHAKATAKRSLPRFAH